jgi:hypothetical protein
MWFPVKNDDNARIFSIFKLYCGRRRISSAPSPEVSNVFLDENLSPSGKTMVAVKSDAGK